MNEPLFDCLADLFGYPRDDYQSLVSRLRAVAPATPLEALAEQFAANVADRTLLELEELYTRTFDLNPICALEVGWHLFGEDYNRGLFLVRVRQLLARYAIAEEGELPDHLAHVLRILARLPRSEAEVFAYAVVMQAVDAMLSGLADKESEFEPLLRAVSAAVGELCPTELVES